MEQNEAARPAHLEQDVRSLFLVDVDVPSTETHDEMILAAVLSLSLDEIEDKRLDEVIRGLSSMSGAAPLRSTYPSSIRNTVAPHVPGTWERIAEIVVSDILSWRSVGRGKINDFIVFLTSRVNQPAAGAVHRGGFSDDQVLFDALRSVAAWGVVAGHSDLVTALMEAAGGVSDSPSEAVAAIRSYDLEELAGGRIMWWDHEAAATELLAQFGERDLEILRSRVLTGTRRPSLTLEELGEAFGCSRQRIQQLESRALVRLEAYLSIDRYRSLNRAADDVRTKIGAASPIEAADAAVADDPESLVDELLLWVAGPYHRSNGWVLHRDFEDIAELVHKAFDDVAVDSVTDREELPIAASRLGLPVAHFQTALSATPEIVGLEDRLVRWSNSIAGRARTTLLVHGMPMTSDDLFEVEPRVANIQSFRNALYAADGLVKMGVHRWGLREWGDDEYPGVVPAMVAAIEDRGPQDVQELAQDLNDRYGVSRASVARNASEHPIFLLDGGVVSLRPADVPYVPKANLVNTKGCFVVNGAWSYRVTVDADVLRGSGRSIPEAFAVHLGVEPLKSGRMAGPERHVALGWGQQPAIGSIRMNVESLGLSNGDLVFIRRSTADSLDFVGIRQPELDAATPSERLRLLVAADPHDRRDSHLIVAEALGMGLASAPSRETVEARLRSRGDAELAELLPVSP